MTSRRYRSRSYSSDELNLSVRSTDLVSDYSKSRSRSRSRSSESEYRLHIADISDAVKKEDLEEIFQEFGQLKEIWMANCPPCFGFAVFNRKSNAVAAIKATDGLMLHGSRLRVTHAKPRTRGTGRRFFNYNMRCYECGEQGHFYRDCPQLHGDYDYGKSPRRSPHHRSHRRPYPYRRRHRSYDRYRYSHRHRH